MSHVCNVRKDKNASWFDAFEKCYCGKSWGISHTMKNNSALIVFNNVMAAKGEVQSFSNRRVLPCIKCFT